MITTKRKLTIPVIAHLPNGSNFIPKDVQHSIVLRDMGLKKELILMTDSYTPELFADIAALGGLALVNNYRRSVVDPERFENDEEEVMSLRGGHLYKNYFSANARKDLSGISAVCVSVDVWFATIETVPGL